MDRQLVWPGAIPLETDILSSEKNALLGLGYAMQDILGVSTLASGLTTTQTTVPSMAVSVAPGRIYSLQNVDGTAYSSLASDTTHQVVKQGILMDAVTLGIAAPGTVGQSINYLIQATYADVDSVPVVLPYYNSSNPSVAYSGPGNTGVAQNTVRKGALTVNAKAGVAAATGSQVTPSPDAGYVGLYVVTVAYGAATVVNANISVYGSAPLITETLTQKLSQATANTLFAALASPAFTGTPTVPTAANGTNTTQAASTAFAYGSLTAGASGSVTLPNGLIIKWGSLSSVTSAGQSVSFPAAFPSAIYFAGWQIVGAGGSGISASSMVSGVSTSGFSAQLGGTGTYNGYWLAIGK